MFIVQVMLPIISDKIFDYICPSYINIMKGSRVIVPFREKKLIGIVLNIIENSKISFKKLKLIYKVLDHNTIFTPALWYTLLWSAKYYQYSLGKILFHVLPTLLKKYTKSELPCLFFQLNNANSCKKITTKLLTNDKISKKISIIDEWNILKKSELSSTKKLNKNFQYIKKNFFCNLNFTEIHQLICNQHKKFFVWLLSGFYNKKRFAIYFQIIKRILLYGKQILIMVPEINNIEKTLLILKKKINVPIEIFHSALNKRKKLNIWSKSYYGETNIVIGTRSALFIPFMRLGTIILEEEHDISYKEKNILRYHIRDLAIVRAKKENIPIIISSLTPSLESVFNVHCGKYEQINFNFFSEYKKLTITTIIDTKDIKSKIKLSKITIEKIRVHLNDKNQILLMFHKKNFFSSLICNACHWKPECKKCDYIYSIYSVKKKLLCSLCDNTISIPKKCAECYSKNLVSDGINHEHIETELKKFFPKVTILRIHRNIFINFKKIDICNRKKNVPDTFILTKEKITSKKNIHCNVTLVLLFNVDSILFSLDFRNTEKFSQMYHQLMMCILQFKKKCEILLHTKYSHDPLLQKLISLNYINFSYQELQNRKNFFLPPCLCHAILRTEDFNCKKSIIFLKKIRHYFNQINQFKDKKFCIVGPTRSNIVKRNAKYRWQLLFQHPSRLFLQTIFKNHLNIIHQLSVKYKIKWIFDMDPIEY